MSKQRVLRICAAAIAIAALTLVTALTASAHAVINVGQYHVAIGWQFEPSSGTVTYVGQPNAIQVFVDIPTSSNPVGTPVSDLNQDCTKPDFQVTVKLGSTTSSPYCPDPVFDADTGRGRLDEYDSTLTPTKVGTYTFRIFGTIHGTPIDQTIASGPMTFDSVGDQSAVEFPAPVPAVADVAAKVDSVGSRASDALASAQTASNGSGRATVLAIVALIVAILLGVVNLAFVQRRRRARGH